MSIHAAACGEEEDAERRKLVSRLMYRSKQRGFLELDLLVGRTYNDDSTTRRCRLRLGPHVTLPYMACAACANLDEQHGVLMLSIPLLFRWGCGRRSTCRA